MNRQYDPLRELQKSRLRTIYICYLAVQLSITTTLIIYISCDPRNNYAKPNVLTIEYIISAVMFMDIIIRLLVNNKIVWKNFSLMMDFLILIGMGITFFAQLIYGSTEFEEEFEQFLIIQRYVLQVIRIGTILYKAKKNFESMYRGKNLFLQDIKINMDRIITRKKKEKVDVVEIV